MSAFGNFRLKAEVTGCLAIAGAVLLSAACAVGAGDSVSNSRCAGLSYGDAGPRRAEYLPCAGEMIAALDPQSRAALTGDQQQRSDGRATLRRLMALMKAAGGRQLLDPWQDRALTDLNLDIHNAVTHYHTFLMMPIKQEPHMFAAKTREAAAAELSGGTRNYQTARSLYRNLGGR